MEVKTSLLFCVLFSIIVGIHCQTGFKIQQPTGFTPIKSHGAATMYTVDGTNYDPPMYILTLKGSRYQMGYDYGYLLAHAVNESYHRLIVGALPKSWEQLAFEFFLDWQWDEYLSKQVPPEYLEELKGIRDGGIAQGFHLVTLDVYMKRVLTVANFPGDVEKNIKYLLESEFGLGGIKPLLFADLNRFKHEHCSFFAAWGPRTEFGQLFTMRNLDWMPNTGANKYKLITIYYPEDGKIPHATIGFAGFQGSLTGMSRAGVTVHEAGNDVKKETFDGFTWSLRLRNVMENVVRVADAVNLWKSTNNTLGLNHMIASAVDITEGNPHPAVALETMAGYTAYFYENDPREAALVYKDPDTGVETPIGAPLEHAVWRTNHGYDPQITSQENKQTKPDTDTATRYMILHDSFQYYESINKPIGVYEAVNITSILGDKGSGRRESFYQCTNTHEGQNIISVTYQPATDAGTMYVAYETGSGDTWRPACCGTYVQLDMQAWWSK